MKLKPLAFLLAAAFAAPTVWAAPGNVVISQVYGGGGNANAPYRNDYIELFNRSNATVDLSGWSLQYSSATGTSWGNQKVALSGSLAPGQYLLVQLGSGGSNGVALPTADIVSANAFNMSATAGKLALVNTSTSLPAATCPSDASIVDLVGFGTTANCFEGAATPAPSATLAVLRAGNGCTDTDSNSGDFATGAPLPRTRQTPLAPCGGGGGNAPITPTCSDASVQFGQGADLEVTATDPDSRVTSATAATPLPAGITLGTLSPALGDGGTATQPVQVAASVPVGSHTVNLQWGNDEQQTASCSFKVNVTGATPIPAIQGSGPTSPMAGTSVTTSGVVTKLASNGFYLQDPVGDGDATTSDGIFVFTSTAPTVSVGQALRLTGTVAEFNTGAPANADTLAHTVTQLASPTGITLLSSGNSIAPVEVDLSTLSLDGLEAYEGMLVTLRGPLMAQQNFFQGRYGQVTLAAGGRVYTPTNLLPPGPDALAMKAANMARSVLLDDGTSAQNVNPTPYIGADNTLRAGDVTGAITGVIDYGLATNNNTGIAMYKIHPLNVAGVAFDRTNPRVATPQVSGGNVRIASANVLNFFTSFANGGVAPGSGGTAGCTEGGETNNGNCRGASNLEEFNRQVAKTVASLSTLNADVVGLMEIQNNGNTAVNHLVSRLNAQMGAGTYASVPLPPQGTGTDAIRVAMIYKPGKLTLNGAVLSDTDAINNRPTLAQGFTLANGEKFAVVVNHLKSKGSCPGAGDADAPGNTDDGLQGCWNALRVQQAVRLKSFLATVKSTAGTEDVVLLGDFNAYAKEDPINTLTSDGGIVDVVGAVHPLDYSYVFDGAAGRLDHGLATSSLVPKVVYATSWHINADEPSFIDYNTEFKVPFSATGSPDFYTPTPYRSSDHDPMVMGLSLVKTVTGGAGRDTLVGTAGDDVIEGGAGADTLTGGGGNNRFVYSSMLDVGDVITDFVPGKDTLVLTKLLAALGIVNADPLASGHVTCTASAAGAIIAIDRDGSAGPLRALQLLQLRGVACGAVTASSFKF